MKNATLSEFLTKAGPAIHIEPKGGRFTIPTLSINDCQVVSEVYEAMFPDRAYDQIHETKEGQYVMPSRLTFVGHFKEPSEALIFTRAIDGLERDNNMLSQVANSIDNLDTFHKRWDADIAMKKAEKIITDPRREGRIQKPPAAQHEHGK